MIPLGQLRQLYETSASQLKSELLLHLNEEQTTCDSADGWAFLVNEARKPLHCDNKSVEILHDCLEFFLIVENTPPVTLSYLDKAEKLEEIFNA